MKKRQQKPKISVKFSSQYPEDAKKDVLVLLKENFVVDVSEEVIIYKDATLLIVLTLGFATFLALREFLKGFAGELGKQLTQRLFKAAEKRPAPRTNVRIIIQYNEQDKYIDGKDESELHQNLLKSMEEIKKEMQKLPKS